MPESRADRALRGIAQGRVRVIKANEAGIALRCASEKPDAAMREVTYKVLIFTKPGEGITRRCDCIAGQTHPNQTKCWHLTAAELLWRYDDQPKTNQPKGIK